MVFLRPTIVRNGQLMDDLSKEKYNYIRAQEVSSREAGLELMDDEKLPILPEWNDELSLPPSFEEHMQKVEDKKLLKTHVKPKESVTILIGPEGDFSSKEISKGIKSGCIPITLGNTRLRAETAALVAVQNISFINQ